MKVTSNYISIFDRIGVTDYNEHNTKEDAVKSLKYGSDNGLIMPIAVIDSNNKIVWYEDFLGESECKSKVDIFINKKKPLNY